MKTKKEFNRTQNSFTLKVDEKEVISSKLSDYPAEVIETMAIYGITKKLQDKFDTLKVDGENATTSQRVDSVIALNDNFKAGVLSLRQSAEQKLMNKLDSVDLPDGISKEQAMELMKMLLAKPKSK